MNKAERAGLTIMTMDELAAGNSPIHRMNGGLKLFLTLLYLLITVSFHKYDLNGLFVMILFPLFGYRLSGISVSECFRRLRIVLPLVCAVGILNPFFDRTPALCVGHITVTGGMLSFLTLLLKGVFCLLASFLLAATTRMEAICGALRAIHLPKMLTSLILLTYRYVGVLLEEAAHMSDALSLRSPGGKGVPFKAWGSFLGQLLIRSMDRAEALYQSMLLRGFSGEFYYVEQLPCRPRAVCITALTAGLMLLCRFISLPAFLAAHIL